MHIPSWHVVQAEPREDAQFPRVLAQLTAPAQLPALLFVSMTAKEVLLLSSSHSVPLVGMNPSSLCGTRMVSPLLPPRVVLISFRVQAPMG